MTAAGRPRSAVLNLSALNLAGKVLAIGKTLFVAALFGTSGALDAFWVAYSLPLMLPMLLTNVATIAFVPRFVRSLEGRTGVEAWRGANTLFTVIVVITLAGCAAIYAWASPLVHRLAPGLAPDVHAQAVTMTRMMVPCVLMLTLSSLLSALSYARERFVLPALDGIVNNLAIIGVALLLARHFGVQSLIVGVTLGFAVQLTILCVGSGDLLRSSLRPAFDFRHPDFLNPLSHMFPLLVGSMGSMLTGLINQYFVSRLDPGSISALTYATMFAMLPVEVFAQAVMTTHYPALGRSFAQGDRAAVAETYRHGLRLIHLLTLPCAALLVVLAKPIIIVLLERGRFDSHSTALTVEAMSILAISMVFRSHSYFSYRVLHSMVRPWIQVLIGLAGVATCIGLNMLWAERLGLRGVALSAVISQIQSAIIASVVVNRLLGVPAAREERQDFVRLLIPVAVLCAGLVVGRLLVPESLYEADHRLWAIATGATAIPALVIAFFVAWKLRIPEVVELLSRVFARRAPSSAKAAGSTPSPEQATMAAANEADAERNVTTLQTNPVADAERTALAAQEAWIAGVVEACRGLRLVSTLPYSKIAFWNDVVETVPVHPGGFLGRFSRRLGIPDPWLPFRLFRAARRADVVLLAGGERADLLYAAMAGLLPGRHAKHIIVDAHWQPYAGAARRLQEWILHAANRIVVEVQPHSTEEIPIYADAFGIPEEKLKAIPYSTSLTGHAVEPRAGDYVLSGGVSFRDYPTFFAGLHGIDCDVRVGIPEGEEAHSARAQVRGLDRVSIHGDWNNADYIEQMAGCHIFALPVTPGLKRSTADQTILNAMALGKIVVATDSIGARIYIEDGVNGFLVDEGSAEDWHRVLQQVLSLGAEESALVAARARRDAVVRFNERIRLARILESAAIHAARPPRSA